MKDPLKDYRSFVLADHLPDPFKDIQSSLGRLQDLTRLDDVFKRSIQFPDPFKDIQSSLGRLQDLTRLDDVFKRSIQFPDPFKELREFQLSIQSLQPIFESIEQEVSVDSDGTITLDTLSIDQSELQEIRDQVLERALVNQPIERLEEIAQKIIEEIRRLKSPLLEKILQWFIFPLLVGLLLSHPITDYHIKSFLSANKREAKKHINHQAHSSFENKDILEGFRYVVADSLNVRLKGSIQSPSIGILRFGDVVVLLKKGRHWSLVEWQDREGQAAIRGWVFSRYLEKFK